MKYINHLSGIFSIYRLMPQVFRWQGFLKIFNKKIECKYAFDYIKRDWKGILKENGFDSFTEAFYFKNYVRLLKAVKQ